MKFDLADVDLERTMCSRGTKIRIEGLDEMGVSLPNTSLIMGIAHVYTILTKEPTLVNSDFLRRVTLTALDEKARKVTVRIADAH